MPHEIMASITAATITSRGRFGGNGRYELVGAALAVMVVVSVRFGAVDQAVMVTVIVVLSILLYVLDYIEGGPGERFSTVLL